MYHTRGEHSNYYKIMAVIDWLIDFWCFNATFNNYKYTCKTARSFEHLALLTARGGRLCVIDIWTLLT